MTKVNPTKFIKQLSNIRSIEVVSDGNNPPVIVWNDVGRRYLVTVEVEEVSGDAFYAREGLFERLAKRRKSSES